jgi:hypothetical protein
MSAAVGWMALALYLSPLEPSWLRAALGALVPVGAALGVGLVRPMRRAVAGILAAFVVVLGAFLAVPASNDRDWQPDVATLPWADIRGDRERDVVRLRTNYRGEDVYVYRLDAPPVYAGGLLRRYLEAVNRLRERPQWYNALTHNCTTTIHMLAAPYERRSWWSWKLLLNGYLDELAYEIGALDRSLPFPALKARSPINARANAAGDDPRFSVRIREGLPRMSGGRGAESTSGAHRWSPGA